MLGGRRERQYTSEIQPRFRLSGCSPGTTYEPHRFPTAEQDLGACLPVDHRGRGYCCTPRSDVIESRMPANETARVFPNRIPRERKALMLLLNIQSSPRGAKSASVAVTNAFLDAYRALHSDATIDTL